MAQTSYSALDLFDMAREGQSGVSHWLPWCDTVLGIMLDGDGQVHAWATEDTAAEVTFPTADMDVQDFEDQLDDLAARAA